MSERLAARRFAADPDRGVWLGACRGLANRSGAPVGLVRAGTVLLTVLGLGLPRVLAYAMVGLLTRR